MLHICLNKNKAHSIYETKWLKSSLLHPGFLTCDDQQMRNFPEAGTYFLLFIKQFREGGYT